ncbi:MAG: hypothetical protein ABH840_04785 [Nanoarchaeota archaeon]
MANQKNLCKNQDKFPRGLVQRLTEAVNYVLDTSRLVGWDEEKMRKLWRGRPLNDLLRNPEINHLFPCLDTSAIATHYLAQKDEEVYLKVLTEKGATKAFREEKARIMHIDSLIELVYDGIPFGLNIGCGDITILRPTNNKDSSISPEEKEYFTTRPEDGERIWRRTPFLKVSGRDFITSPELSPLDFLETCHNLVKVPCDITKEDFYTARDVPGKDSILRTNYRDYNPLDSASFNKEWLDTNKEFLPGLREFQYK